MESNRWCIRCGKKLTTLEIPTNYEYGFKNVSLDLCTQCKAYVNKRFLVLQEQYKGKMLKLFNKFYSKLLK